MSNVELGCANNSFIISELLIYPVKSMGGISMESCLVTERGLEHDRRWMLVDAKNRYITQREFPELVFFRTAIVGNCLIITDKRDDCSIHIPLVTNSGEIIAVNIWDDRCEAICLDQQIADWFSARLSQPVRMVYMHEASKRLVDSNYAKNGELTSFSDGYPVLMVGEASLKDLNSRLQNPVGMNRFRPNIVFSGSVPYAEDGYHEIIAGSAHFKGVKPCARCILTTTDQQSGVRAAEPLKTLSLYRKFNNKVYFGQNLLVIGNGVMYVGDSIQVLSHHSISFNTGS